VIAAGDAAVIVESMKMEMRIAAAGVVAEVFSVPGRKVWADQRVAV
jgi:biotin carboxyl carrier protein